MPLNYDWADPEVSVAHAAWMWVNWMLDCLLTIVRRSMSRVSSGTHPPRYDGFDCKPVDGDAPRDVIE